MPFKLYSAGEHISIVRVTICVARQGIWFLVQRKVSSECIFNIIYFAIRETYFRDTLLFVYMSPTLKFMNESRFETPELCENMPVPKFIDQLLESERLRPMPALRNRFDMAYPSKLISAPPWLNI
jgi:hypothetical protein